MKPIFYIVLLITVVSCNKNDSTKNKKLTVPDSLISNDKPNFKIDKIPEDCYLQIVGKDSTAIHLVDNLGTFSGKMAVKNSEKDSSSGDLSGFKNEDTLKLTYSFDSEGVNSERSIYFLQKDGELIEGIGDYKQPKSLKFEDKNPYKKIDCSKIEKLLK